MRGRPTLYQRRGVAVAALREEGTGTAQVLLLEIDALGTTILHSVSGGEEGVPHIIPSKFSIVQYLTQGHLKKKASNILHWLLQYQGQKGTHPTVKLSACIQYCALNICNQYNVMLQKAADTSSFINGEENQIIYVQEDIRKVGERPT